MKVTKSLVLGLAVLLATSAFAANKGSLQVQEPISVNGQQLKPGDYKVQWDGSGPNVELSIMQGKKVVTKVPAHVVDLSSASNADAAVVKNNADGSTCTQNIQRHAAWFNHKLSVEAPAAFANR